MFGVDARFIGKSQRSSIGVACVMEIDSVVATDMFHRDFKRNGLRVQFPGRVSTACENADRIRSRILSLRKNVHLCNRMWPQCMPWCCGGNTEIGEGIAQTRLAELF